MLKIYNTLTGKKEPFEPLTAGTVKMYVCGVTVYDECHLGHARSALVFEMIRRYLEHSGLSVTFVKNFTDVDDKIINRANELKIPWQAVTARYIDRCLFSGREIWRLWPALQAQARRHAGRRPRRGGRTQAPSDGFRPVERREAWRAVMGQPLGEGPARVAH